MKNYRPAVFIVAYKKERKKNKILYLLLKRKLHWIGWEFPKGGIEKNENFFAATKRETKEETGQNPSRIISFPYSGKYKYHKVLLDRPNFYGQTFKLFSAELKTKKIKFDKKEHSAFKWLPYNQALALLTWPNQKKCLEIVNKELS